MTGDPDGVADTDCLAVVQVFFGPSTQTGIYGELGSAHGDESTERKAGGEFHMKAVVACLIKSSKRRSGQPYLYMQLLLRSTVIHRRRDLQLREECLEIGKSTSRLPRAEDLLVSIASIGKSYKSTCFDPSITLYEYLKPIRKQGKVSSVTQARPSRSCNDIRLMC